eukprot:1867101-Amphidinium_carterae.1
MLAHLNILWRLVLSFQLQVDVGGCLVCECQADSSEESVQSPTILCPQQRPSQQTPNASLISQHTEGSVSLRQFAKSVVSNER